MCETHQSTHKQHATEILSIKSLRWIAKRCNPCGKLKGSGEIEFEVNPNLQTRKNNTKSQERKKSMAAAVKPKIIVQVVSDIV